MTLPVGPPRAPFFVAKCGDEADGVKNFSEGLAVGDFGFGFDAVLVGIFAGAGVRQALVGQQAVAGVVADAEDFSAGAHLAVGCVVEDVGLKGAGSLEGEGGCLGGASCRERV